MVSLIRWSINAYLKQLKEESQVDHVIAVYGVLSDLRLWENLSGGKPLKKVITVFEETDE